MAISPQGRCAGKAAWDAKRAWRGTAGLGGVETHAGDEGGWQDGVGVAEDDGEGAGGGAWWCLMREDNIWNGFTFTFEIDTVTLCCVPTAAIRVGRVQSERR